MNNSTSFTKMHNEMIKLRERAEKAEAGLAEAQAILAKLREDAERYRWLSDDGGIHSLPYDDFGCGPVFDLSRDTIDAARDVK